MKSKSHPLHTQKGNTMRCSAPLKTEMVDNYDSNVVQVHDTRTHGSHYQAQATSVTLLSQSALPSLSFGSAQSSDPYRTTSCAPPPKSVPPTMIGIQNHFRSHSPSRAAEALSGSTYINPRNASVAERLQNLRVNLNSPNTTALSDSTRHNDKRMVDNTATWRTDIRGIAVNKIARATSLYGKFGKLGQGLFARVYKTTRKDSQRTVALKVFNRNDPRAERSFSNELMLLDNVSHPNIVHLFDAHIDPKYFYLEMEVCRGGDLFSHLSSNGRFSEGTSRMVLFQLNDVIQYLHQRDFVHRDLKPENVVFVQNGNLREIRLIDFGESICVDPQGEYTDFVGTTCYMAPERFRPHSGAELKMSDVWAIGVIMFEMLTGCRCFGGGNNTALVQRNVVTKNMAKWPLNVIVSADGLDFLNSLLAMDPLRRMSCQQALHHRWFN